MLSHAGIPVAFRDLAVQYDTFSHREPDEAMDSSRTITCKPESNNYKVQHGYSTK